MITHLAWNYDSSEAIDLVISGISGDGNTAGCQFDGNSPSGKWHISLIDSVQPASDPAKISFIHGSSTILNRTNNTQFIFAPFSDDFPNTPPAKDGESQTGQPVVPGWVAYQSMVLLSERAPNSSSTWTWVINYHAHKA